MKACASVRVSDNGFTVVLEPDPGLPNPRRDPSNRLGGLICFLPHRPWGDPHRFRSEREFLESFLPADTVRTLREASDRRWKRLKGGLPWENGAAEALQEERREYRDALDGHVVLAMVYNTAPDPKKERVLCSDPERVSLFARPEGWVYMTREEALSRYGPDAWTPEGKARVRRELCREVARYDACLRGDGWSYTLFGPDGEVRTAERFIPGEREAIRRADAAVEAWSKRSIVQRVEVPERDRR